MDDADDGYSPADGSTPLTPEANRAPATRQPPVARQRPPTPRSHSARNGLSAAGNELLYWNLSF